MKMAVSSMPTKESVLFIQKSGFIANPDVELHGQQIPVNPEHKFLDIMLDTKLTFVSHK